MNKIRVIDLLNKIANGEEVPDKIHYGLYDYKLVEYNKTTKLYQCLSEPYELIDIKTNCLNDEVEIIEDKKIEKLDIALLGQCDNWIHKYNTEKKEFESLGEEINPYIIDTIRENTIAFQKKINEIIDYLEEKE